VNGFVAASSSFAEDRKMSTPNAKAFIKLILAGFTLFACGVLFFGCGSGGGSDGGSSEAGSLSFRLTLAETERGFMPLQATQQAGVSCEETGIATILAQVLDENGGLLVEGGPFECEAHEGLVDEVPAGHNRVLVLYANDESGVTIFRGRAEGLTIIGGMTTDAGTIALELLNNPPVAHAGPDQTRFVGDTVTLDGSGSYDIDGDVLTYSWSLIIVPQGSLAELSNPTAVKPTFVIDQLGDYVAQLIVNDGIEDSDPDTVSINWLNSKPVANAGNELTYYASDVGSTVTLDGSGSSDVDGQLLTYSWSLITVPEGSEAFLFDPTAVNPTFVIDQLGGDYVAQLIVNDGIEDSDPDTVSINWENTWPVADAGADQTASIGDTVTLDGSGSSDVDGDVLSYFWSLIAIPEGSGASLSDATLVNPTFVIDQPGDYVVQLIVNDGIEDSVPDTVSIEGMAPPSLFEAYYSLLGLNTITDPEGGLNYSNFELGFDYLDINGDANEASGASLNVEFQFFYLEGDANFYEVDMTQALVGIDGFSGSVLFEQPIRFDNTNGVIIRFILTDGYGNTSNALELTINRPEGAN
jgi:hypothetical protein